MLLGAEIDKASSPPELLKEFEQILSANSGVSSDIFETLTFKFEHLHAYESIQTPLLDNLVYIVKLHAKPVLMHMSAKGPCINSM